MGTLGGKWLRNWLLSSSMIVFVVQVSCWFWGHVSTWWVPTVTSRWFRSFHYLVGVLRLLLSLLYLYPNQQNFSKDTQSGMSIILYKYHNANLGPLLQTCKCRVQSSSNVIYGSINTQLKKSPKWKYSLIILNVWILMWHIRKGPPKTC